MRVVRVALVAAVVGLWPSGHGRAGEAETRPLIFAGCGATGPITRMLADAFAVTQSAAPIDMRTVGSTNGIWLAAAGAVQVGLVSRSLTATELDLGLTVVPYARTALVIAAHPSSAESSSNNRPPGGRLLARTEDSITTGELVAIYGGTRPRWRNGQAITLLTREPGDSSVQILSRQVPGFRAAYAETRRTSRAMLAYSEQAMLRALTTRPNALGFTDLGTLTMERLPIRPLTVNGVAPTMETLASGRYPLVKTLALVFRPEKVPADVSAFVDFVRSPAGETILRANSYLPAE